MRNVKIAWILALVCLFTLVPSCNAGVAISGSFYAHDYVLTQGEDISSRDLYVYVFNKEDKRVCVDVEYESPEFIEVGLSTRSCSLNPDEYERVYITLKAKEDAVPGDYKVKVIALIKEVKGDQPIKVLTSAAQEADVTVVGEYADVDLAAIDPVGNIAFTALVQLFYSGYGIASADGELKKRVVPGNYTAKAYLLGEEVASADFVVATYETKRVELPIRGVYFDNFSVEPVKNESGGIIYVPVLAGVNNHYKELSNAYIALNVFTGASSENYTLYSSVRLPLNRTETQFNYIPLMGWQSGKYEFTANVVSDGIVYAVSPVITVEDLTFGAGYKRAQTFVFADNDTTVTNVRVYLKRADVSVSGDIIVTIHEDGGTEPGTELACCTIANSSVNTTYAWLNASCNCTLANGTTHWLVLASPDASGGYDYYWGADYKSNGGEAWYYDAKSWTTANLEGVIMAFELFV